MRKHQKRLSGRLGKLLCLYAAIGTGTGAFALLDAGYRNFPNRGFGRSFDIIVGVALAIGAVVMVVWYHILRDDSMDK